ncbi:hypothetical protein [Nocardiopsis sp. FIRDI 009]|uniref:hypothetical protein n=1 Tax=Nocardiopsis sp. FIRDI 009 TaxID=714197 RepID=UPI0018E55501|nr:hypothetical protein [Nocardiopsis sp. FIRDI 009]
MSCSLPGLGSARVGVSSVEGEAPAVRSGPAGVDKHGSRPPDPAHTWRAAPDDLVPRLAAAQLAAADRTLFRRVQELTLGGWDDARIAETVAASAERAFALLEGSLKDYAVR